MSQNYALDASLVIPCYNDFKSLPVLLEEITSSLAGLKINFEVIVVDDGSDCELSANFRDSVADRNNITVVRHPNNLGKSAAWCSGFARACGRYIFTLDADLQDDPRFIGAMIASLDSGLDVISGYRQNWQNGHLKLLTSRLYNFVLNHIGGTKIHDHNCGMKGFRSNWVQGLELAAGQHRILVALLALRGARTGEVQVDHRPRIHGSSHYGATRFIEFGICLAYLLFGDPWSQSMAPHELKVH